MNRLKVTTVTLKKMMKEQVVSEKEKEIDNIKKNS